MPEAQQIHIHLTPQPGSTVHVTIAGDNVTVATDNSEADTDAREPVVSLDDAIEEAIQRLESSGASPNIRKAVDGLLSLGYTLRRPKTIPDKRPENYLRIMDPTYTAHGVGYLTPTMFSFSRGSDRQRLMELPEATPISNAVNFDHVRSAQPGLDAAKLLKRHAPTVGFQDNVVGSTRVHRSPLDQAS
jgi:hypothetical protein